jgi:hypothetical protein
LKIFHFIETRKKARIYTALWQTQCQDQILCYFLISQIFLDYHFGNDDDDGVDVDSSETKGQIKSEE